jgi:hypothetical protein
LNGHPAEFRFQNTDSLSANPKAAARIVVGDYFFFEVSRREAMSATNVAKGFVHAPNAILRFQPVGELSLICPTCLRHLNVQPCVHGKNNRLQPNRDVIERRRFNISIDYSPNDFECSLGTNTCSRNIEFLLWLRFQFLKIICKLSRYGSDTQGRPHVSISLIAPSREVRRNQLADRNRYCDAPDSDICHYTKPTCSDAFGGDRKTNDVIARHAVCLLLLANMLGEEHVVHRLIGAAS